MPGASNARCKHGKQRLTHQGLGADCSICLNQAHCKMPKNLSNYALCNPLQQASFQFPRQYKSQHNGPNPTFYASMPSTFELEACKYSNMHIYKYVDILLHSQRSPPAQNLNAGRLPQCPIERLHCNSDLRCRL